MRWGSGGFLGRLLVILLNTGFLLIGNVVKPLAKSALIPLGLTLAASATDAAIHQKTFGSGFTTFVTTLIYNEEQEDIKKIAKFHEDSGLLIEVLAKQIKMKQKNKEQK